MHRKTFTEALDRAERKQTRIFLSTKCAYVLSSWYLMELTAEAVQDIEMEQFTYRRYSMKKEPLGSAKELARIHIVPVLERLLKEVQHVRTRHF